MNRTQDEVLDDLKFNVRRLLEKVEVLRQDNIRLKKDLDDCLCEIESMKNINRDLGKKLKLKNIADTLSGNGDRTEAKNSIDKILREVSNCIRLLDY